MTSADVRAVRAALVDEFTRIEERAMWSAQGQFEQHKTWGSVNLWLGTATAVTAAISGGLTLAADQLNVIGGALALMSAAGGAVLTTVNPSSRANRAASAANAYLEIQTAARQARLVDLPEEQGVCKVDLLFRDDVEGASWVSVAGS